LPINEFYFAGFFPKVKKQMIEFLNQIRKNEKTSVFFVSSHKIKICLDLIEIKMDDRLISVSKELTKVNEKVFRGLAGEVKDKININKNNLKGEFVVAVGGNIEEKKPSAELKNNEIIIKKLLAKFSLTDVVQIVHKLSGIRKSEVYKWVLNIKK
jgi:Predicted methyltransferases